jgi:Na+-transporting NADH:ubiquinone oxidoreductase subunit C
LFFNIENLLFMNRDSNTYTFLYASGLVIIVAAVLSFTAISLKDRQDQNIRVAKKIEILKSVNVESTAIDAEAKYEELIKTTYVLNCKGEQVEGNAFDIDLSKEVKKSTAERHLPVYIYSDAGDEKFILPVMGKGLWGPIWGYIALNEDKNTIFGATFSHKSETPGLGAEITLPAFQDQFKGKLIQKDNKVYFEVAKGKADPDDKNAVDGITGGTLTSKGLEAMMNQCLSAYDIFLKDVVVEQLDTAITDSIPSENLEIN